MRVLQVHKDFEPFAGGGGTARHIHGLAKALTARGCEVRVASLHPTVIEAPYRSMHVAPERLGREIAWADVVHVHGGRSHYALNGAAVAFVRRKPFVYTPHAYYDGRTLPNKVAKAVWDRTAEKFLVQKSSRTILLTSAWYKFLQDRNIPVGRTTVIPNCVLGEDLMAPVALDEAPRLVGRPAVLSVGRLDPVKRVGDVIQAMAVPGLEAAHFHVVGKGKQREALERQAAELGVAARVTFHGFVDDSGVSQMVGGSDVFVLASEQEGLPTVLLEMMLAGLPVICTRIPGNLAITNVAGVATTYEVGDVSALAALLARAADMRGSLGDAEARLRQAFLWEERVRDVLALYQDCTGPDTKAA